MSATPDERIIMSAKVRKGTQFRSPIADTIALWEVTSVRGDTALAFVVDEPYDIGGVTYPGEYAGQTDAFLVSDIQSRNGLDKVFADLAKRGDDYFDSLVPGEIVHYHNSFGEYVRCVVTEDRLLQPIALIGTWKPYTISRRLATGEITYGYHALHIVDQDGAWRPSDSCVYESPTFSAPRGEGRDFDPRTLEPLPLEPPPLDEIGELRAELWRAWYAAGEAIDNHFEVGIEETLPRVIENLSARVNKALGVNA